jgi:hypothetical protein
MSDEKQRLCFALALWNGKDPILKERLFGLTNSEGNHGEDVKEYYFYLDSTPTHSYMKYLYKYPQRAYPYGDLLESNRRRSRDEFEYELIDTGVFDDDRYFDVVVEYAKVSPDELLIQITATNRGPEDAPLHVLPTLWFRNTWSWWNDVPKPSLERLNGPNGTSLIGAAHAEMGQYFLYCEGAVPLLFTENETNNERLFGTPNASPFVKDGINNFVVKGQWDAVNPQARGTKAAAHYGMVVPAGESRSLRLRLSDHPPDLVIGPFGAEFDVELEARRREADEFYHSITPSGLDADRTNVMRQAMAGMFWGKQYYFWDGHKWLEEHSADPMHPAPTEVRNRDWYHMINDHIISMPDKWEYPWYAAWDLAFQAVAMAPADIDFAKQQLDLMLRVIYLHPSGQIPAYEWNFSDVNPPVHAWATIYLYRMEQTLRGEGDIEFLKRGLGKLMANFAW